MSFIENFDENDATDLVANGLGLKQYSCGWITNGQPCNAPVLGNNVPTHLKTMHPGHDASKLRCSWGDCGESLNKGCLVRHVQEKHLEYRWPCPKCPAIFTRRGVLNTHRAVCTGAAN